VLAPASKNRELLEKLIPELPYLKAEILYAVTNEGALSIDDVLSRRTRISFEAKDQGLSAMEKVADLISEILGWDSKDKKASISQYRELVERQNEVLLQTKELKERVS
jgi:glycerol-3-phosphate dehydrogenase